jgi:hypothetical protein
MLKCCVRPLITLVLALMATGLLSTLCSARDLRGPNGAAAVGAMDNAKPRPVGTSGEPDQPCSPPPPVRLTGSISAPLSPDQGAGNDYELIFRWTGWVWAYWFARGAL